MRTATLSSDITRWVLVDALIVAAFLALPSVSHLLPIPLYMLEPMRIAMLVAFLTTKSVWNAVLMGLTIPIFSHLTAGHPELVKAFLISTELATNMLVFVHLYRRFNLHASILMILSVLISKTVYYALKYLTLVTGLLDDRLISSSVMNQLIALLIVTVILSLFVPARNEFK